MISTSRAALSRSGARRERRCSLQSGMVDSRDEAHGVDECFPGVALACENAAALGGKTVEASAALASLLDPLSLKPPTLFQPVEQRIQGRDVKLQLASGTRLDELADLVSMTGARLDDRENDQLRRSLLQFTVQH